MGVIQASEIVGMVRDPDGAPLPYAIIQASSVAGAIHRTLSTETGEYKLSDLPSGSYDVSISLTFLTPFIKKAAVVGDVPLRLDARLDYGLTLGTPGEGHEYALAAVHRVAPKGHTPRLRSGKPDLSGVWTWPITLDPGMPEWLPAAAPDGSPVPSTFCLTHSLDWSNPYFKFVHTPNLLVILLEDDTPNYRQVFLDGRKHPDDPFLTWWGHSIGHWEGDALVVDRIGFTEKSWLDLAGHRHSDQLHIVDRYRRPDFGHLEIETTYEDPVAFSKPWAARKVSILSTDQDVQEYACADNNKDVVHLGK
jgi:hypothetical protein